MYLLDTNVCVQYLRGKIAEVRNVFRNADATGAYASRGTE